jgi:translation initiation factor 3 subunit E
LATLIFFNKTRDEDLERYVDLCNEKSNFSVIQLLCPQLLRYLVVAALVNKNLHKNRNYSFDFYKLTEIIKRGIVKYSDPFTELIENLYLNFDFESAARNITEIQTAVSKDILLIPLKDKIIESCQFLYFKVYCKIH